MLNVPNRTINWIIDFLSNRSQRIKLGEAVYLIGHQTLKRAPANQIRALASFDYD